MTRCHQLAAALVIHLFPGRTLMYIVLAHFSISFVHLFPILLDVQVVCATAFDVCHTPLPYTSFMCKYMTSCSTAIAYHHGFQVRPL